MCHTFTLNQRSQPCLVKPLFLILLLSWFFLVLLGLPAMTAWADPPGSDDVDVEAINLFSFVENAVDAINDATDAAETQIAQWAITRIERWAGSFDGCMTGATPQERALTVSIEYTCACLATYIVNLCAPLDTTTNDEVASCTSVNMMGIQNAFNSCLYYGQMYVSIP